MVFLIRTGSLSLRILAICLQRQVSARCKTLQRPSGMVEHWKECWESFDGPIVFEEQLWTDVQQLIESGASSPKTRTG